MRGRLVPALLAAASLQATAAGDRRALGIDWGRDATLIVSDHARQRALGVRACFRDYLCERWNDQGASHAISIYAWRPSAQSRAMFADVIRSIRR